MQVSKAINPSEHTFWGISWFVNINPESRITCVVLIVILLLTYFTLLVVPFPNYQEAVEIEEEIFIMIKPEAPPEFKPQEKTEKPTEPEHKDDNVSADRIAEDLERFVSDQNVTPDIGSDLVSIDENLLGGGGNEIDIDVEIDIPISGDPSHGLNVIEGELESIAALARGADEMMGTSTDPGLKVRNGTTFKISDGTGGGNGGGYGPSTGSKVGKTVDQQQGVSVTLIPPVDIEVPGLDILSPLIEWMKKHQKKHPPAIKSHLKHKSGDLTSVINFIASGVQTEIYLQCTEATKELAILIVQGENSTKLVDQGISERSHRYEVGTALRDETDSHITGFNSSIESPTREVTNQFMRIFLTWWSNGKPITE